MNTVIVTGLSGAGKTQAMNCLEDLGYYCVDNMPPTLIQNFIQLASNEATPIEKAAFAVDVRGRELFPDFEKTLSELEAAGEEYRILYLEASDQVLMRRFNETRRKHPLSEGGSIQDGLNQERKMLEDLRSRATYIIDTSNMKSARLWQEVKDLITSGESEKTFMINIMSFGYKKGLPLGADMVFDMRFIPNPYYVKSLRNLTGNNQKVQSYVLRHEDTKRFIATVSQMINDMIPSYIREGKYNLNLAFGCTGGHHRSVSVANEMSRIFQSQGRRVTIEHRDL